MMQPGKALQLFRVHSEPEMLEEVFLNKEE
jgi:hypothetical protein